MGNLNTTNIKRKKSNFGFYLFLLASLFIITIVGKYYYSYSNFKTQTITNKEKIITIKNGDNFNSISHKIEGIDENLLKLYLKFNKPNFELQSGRYKIEKDSDIKNIIMSLKNPIPSEEIYITIFEGWNIYDIDYCLSNPKKLFKETGLICAYKYDDNGKKELIESLIEENEYIDYVTNPDKIETISAIEGANFGFVKGLKSLEGYLYPDSYKLSLNKFEVRKLVVDKQLSAFEEKVYRNLLKDLDNKTINDLINMASIVEKEEKNPAEKATVAGILKKRLNAGWKIGADITVCYPYKLRSEECKMVVSKYINKESEYNTRTIVGLPKTPIGNPSFETIEATLNDKESDYWFYLHNVKTGKIYYGETNAEHERNKQYMY